MRRPHDAREQLHRARAQLSKKTNPREPASVKEVAQARRVYWHARTRLSQRVKRAQERKINEARTKMVEVRNHVERLYYITSLDRNSSIPVLRATDERHARHCHTRTQNRCIDFAHGLPPGRTGNGIQELVWDRACAAKFQRPT